MFPDILKTLLERTSTANLDASRTDALAPLFRLFVVLATLAGLVVWREAPNWVVCGCGAACFVVLLAYVGAFFFFAAKKPELLRSERYQAFHHAMERGLIGDHTKGLFDNPPSRPAEITESSVGGVASETHDSERNDA